MAITEVAYCTREDVQRALNIADTPRLTALIDRSVQAGARDAEGSLNRFFYPTTKTVRFDLPEATNLYLYENELAGAPTQIISGDEQMTVGLDVFLRPKSGPPYRWLEVNYAGGVWWQALNTPQEAIAITGDYGYPTTLDAAATLTGSITNSATTLTLSDSSSIGCGSLVLIDSERLLVTEKTFVSTTATLAADLALSKSTTTMTVNNGALLNVGELIVIDSERMFIESVAGNAVTVDRAVNASTLALHTNGTTIYAPRQATVRRGQCGTSAASHNSAAAISRILAPSLVRDYNLALAIVSVQQALGAYTKQLGSGGNSRPASGTSLDVIAADVQKAYGRKVRGRAV